MPSFLLQALTVVDASPTWREQVDDIKVPTNFDVSATADFKTDHLSTHEDGY